MSGNQGFPGGKDGEEPARSAGRSPGEGNGNPLQYSCLQNSKDRGALQATGRKESDMAEVTITQGLSESPLFKANKHRKQTNSNPLWMVIQGWATGFDGKQKGTFGQAAPNCPSWQPSRCVLRGPEPSK